MATETFRVIIEGYWKDEKANDKLPRYPGLFFAFEARPNTSGVTLLRLIYVGASDKVRDGILAFRKNFDEVRFLREGNILCYHAAWVAEAANRERMQAAFIYAHKPPANDKFKYRFPYAETRIITEGQMGFLKEDFTV